MSDLSTLVRAERLALIDLLETLDPQEWATPSLCDGWTVQDVAAHLASAPALTTRQAVFEMARVGFRPNRFNTASTRRWTRRHGSAAIVRQLKANAESDAKPVGVPPIAVLVDAVVHALDIRRPLGRPRPVPPAAFVPTASFCAATRWPASIMVGGDVQARTKGLRLVADDVDWSRGEGPEVHGTGVALILMLAGRRIGRDELSGDGAEQLYSRL